ncbi:30S ribosomal protein S20 [Candidatus Peregrinibacteria bacterium]|jgi:small subunit ribosomal protein S20|nr:30S ribosomal protein S20 [Candidatus Peregrinibacteria bacterium]
MPIIRSAKKQMRQSLKNRQRNFRMRRTLHDAMRELSDLIKDGNKADATKALSAAYKVIDTAVKKNLLHQNNGNRKKSAFAKKIAEMK